MYVSCVDFMEHRWLKLTVLTCIFAPTAWQTLLKQRAIRTSLARGAITGELAAQLRVKVQGKTYAEIRVTWI